LFSDHSSFDFSATSFTQISSSRPDYSPKLHAKTRNLSLKPTLTEGEDVDVHVWVWSAN